MNHKKKILEMLEAAKELKMTAQTVRILMQQKQLDIGYVKAMENGRHVYIILRSLLDKELNRIA